MLSKLRSYLIYNADQNNSDSVSRILRKKRFEFFLSYIKELRKPLKIIDLGGSDYYWKNIGFANDGNYQITILNIDHQDVSGLKNISFIKSDVRDLDFIKDNDYDLVYSNSLIEHLNKFDEQKKLASEIQRIGKNYFIQTPNYYFFIEPHFLFPFFQFAGTETKTKLITKYDLGWFKKQPDLNKARELAESIRLLKKDELEEIFPGCRIYNEKFIGMNKSFIVYN